MYTLTLTHSERSAIDWVGYRYATGDKLSSVLFGYCQPSGNSIEWDDNADITFVIAENHARTIRELCEEEDMLFPCFSGTLASKLMAFCYSLV